MENGEGEWQMQGLLLLIVHPESCVLPDAPR
jgi:hypothetical protein